MINVIEGKPGSGKTYILAQWLKEFLDKGIDCYSNFWVNDPRVKYYKKLTDLNDVKNGIIFMDEGQVYINSRNWENMPTSFQYKLQQHRKHALHLFVSVQSVSRLDIVLRELIGGYYRVGKIGSNEKEDGSLPKKPYGLFFVRQYEPESIGKAKLKKLSLFPSFRLMTKIGCSYYDTTRDIGFEKNDDDVISVNMKVCPACGSRKILKD